jgi:hypothetical protein
MDGASRTCEELLTGFERLVSPCGWLARGPQLTCVSNIEHELPYKQLRAAEKASSSILVVGRKTDTVRGSNMLRNVKFIYLWL